MWPCEFIVPLQSVPSAEVFAATMVFLMFTVPVPLFLIPPPPPGVMKPALLPVTVTLMRETVPPVRLCKPPPPLVVPVAMFPLMVTLVMVAVADDSL